MAAWSGHVDLTQLLLSSDVCHVDIPGPGGGGSVTPVFLAAQQRHHHVVQLLVGAGCDVTGRATLRVRGGGVGHVASDVTVLHVAAQAGHVGVVRRLLAAGALRDATMSAGQLGSVTALHLAIEAGHDDVVDALIDAGCDVNGRTSATVFVDSSHSSSAYSTTV